MRTFGPVPSRRLGRSLGINNIPPKVCSYACVYCQVGRTLRMRTDRQTFYPPDELVAEVFAAVDRSREAGEQIDFLSFVPDGEPTLDVNLGREIELLRPLEIGLAVITNSSLISRPDVRADLMNVDWVSLKFDAVREDVWRRINAPRADLDLTEIQEGARRFADEYRGRLVTETMLIEGLNDDVALLEELADFLAELHPEVSYLSIPTRPPARDWVHAPDEEVLARAWHVFDRKIESVEVLAGYEGDTFTSSGRFEEDLLAITSVHPMREAAVRALLERTGNDWSVVRALLGRGELVKTNYAGHTYFSRRLGNPLARAPSRPRHPE